MHNKIGYIKLYRSLLENEIYQLPPLYLRVFERLILEANHQDNEIPYRKKGEVKTKLIKRGEKLTSIRQISEWVGWYERGIFKTPNPKLIKEILDYLVENEMIIIYDKSNRTETHYKVVNYDVYQDKEDVKVTEQKQKRNDLETEKKRLVPTNNNDKNGKNEKEDNIYTDIYDYYLSLKLIQHKKLTLAMKKAIDLAIKQNSYTLEEMKELLKRHKEKVEETKNNGQYAVKPRKLDEFFGQKIQGAISLICTQYDEGGKYYNPNVKDNKQNDFEPIVRRDDY